MWYSAKLLFRADVCDGVNVPRLHEESTRLIQADTEDQARDIALQIGVESQHSYQNEDGNSVNWQFVEVVEIQDLCESEVYSGIEVFSRLFRDTGLHEKSSQK